MLSLTFPDFPVVEVELELLMLVTQSFNVVGQESFEFSPFISGRFIVAKANDKS